MERAPTSRQQPPSASASASLPYHARPNSPGANLYMCQRKILSYIKSIHHSDKIIDTDDGFHCDDESESIPGT